MHAAPNYLSGPVLLGTQPRWGIGRRLPKTQNWLVAGTKLGTHLTVILTVLAMFIWSLLLQITSQHLGGGWKSMNVPISYGYKTDVELKIVRMCEIRKWEWGQDEEMKKTDFPFSNTIRFHVSGGSAHCDWESVKQDIKIKSEFGKKALGRCLFTHASRALHANSRLLPKAFQTCSVALKHIHSLM